MQPAHRIVLLAGLAITITLFLIRAASPADNRSTIPDSKTWLVIFGIGSVAFVLMAVVIWYSLRIGKRFHDNTSSLIDILRALTPMPLVTLSDEIPEGMDGRLEVRISGFSSVPFGQVTVMLAPPQGLALERNHIVLPRLDPDETKIVWIAHGPARKGKHGVRVTVLYRAGDQERVREFTRIVYAGIPAEPETVE